MPKPLTANPELSTMVYRNHWRDIFDGNVPEGWQPTMKVSVVIASYNSATVHLTLASLAAQDYPEDLLEVICVDDGSEEPVVPGEFVPKNLTVVRVGEGEGWGRSNAMDIAIKRSTGDIIYWVDSDMVLFSDNVRQHAKWGHFIPEAATIGHKGFVEEWDFTPEQVFNDVKSGKIREYHNLDDLHRHWSIDIYDKTDDLNESDGRNYSTHMGACASVTRLVYERTNGQDTRLHLGEDTEIAYQLWQAGAVFIPVHEAPGWHLGRATVQDHAAAVSHVNDVHFAQRMPIPRYRRTPKRLFWEVPWATVVVPITLETAQFARACVDRILSCSEADLRVILVGPWSTLDEGRRKMMADPRNELFLTHEWYRADCRVVFAEEAPETVFPSPYRVDVPVTAGFSPDGLKRLLYKIDGEHLGRVHCFTPGHDRDQSVTATATVAYERARSYVSSSVSLEEAIDAGWGVEWVTFAPEQLYDLREVDLSEKVSGVDPEIGRWKQRAERAEDRVSKLSGTGSELAKWRKRTEQAETEVAALKKRTATLKRQLAKAQVEPPSLYTRARRKAGRVARKLGWRSDSSATAHSSSQA